MPVYFDNSKEPTFVRPTDLHRAIDTETLIKDTMLYMQNTQKNIFHILVDFARVAPEQKQPKQPIYIQRLHQQMRLLCKRYSLIKNTLVLTAMMQNAPRSESVAKLDELKQTVTGVFVSATKQFPDHDFVFKTTNYQYPRADTNSPSTVTAALGML